MEPLPDKSQDSTALKIFGTVCIILMCILFLVLAWLAGAFSGANF